MSTMRIIVVLQTFFGITAPMHGAENAVAMKYRFPIGHDVVDWSWGGGKYLAFCGFGVTGLAIRFAELTENAVEYMKGERVESGSLPVFVHENRVVYAHLGRRLGIVAIADGKASIVASSSVELRGGINEIRLIAGKLWLYTVEAAGNQSLVARSYCTTPTLGDIITLGSGYYPRPLPGQFFLYVDAKKDYALRKGMFDVGTSADDPILIEKNTFFPEVSKSENVLVYQDGSADRSAVVVANLEGKYVRTLSTPKMIGMYPRLSATGRYVAFAEYAPDNEELVVVRILRLDGTTVYTRNCSRCTASTLFRWSPLGDRLGILCRDNEGQQVLEIVDFPDL